MFSGRQRFVYSIAAGDFEHGGDATTQLKGELDRLGVNKSLIRRVVIIAFEGEINIIVYSTSGGEMTVEVSDGYIDLSFQDSGPGIVDVEQAMTAGFSTAPDWAIELGFGAGMGLGNMRENADLFEIESAPDKWTLVHCRIDRRDHDLK
ncbi:MAG: anti-sigma regulatory factor [Candidatus Bipolaricaulota bacterium]|nr:anti-sigma regulatory factor [Candidatus Bipolaricaulota bacterium]